MDRQAKPVWRATLTIADSESIAAGNALSSCSKRRSSLPAWANAWSILLSRESVMASAVCASIWLVKTALNDRKHALPACALRTHPVWTQSRVLRALVGAHGAVARRGNRPVRGAASRIARGVAQHVSQGACGGFGCRWQPRIGHGMFGNADGPARARHRLRGAFQALEIASNSIKQAQQRKQPMKAYDQKNVLSQSLCLHVECSLSPFLPLHKPRQPHANSRE